MSGSKRYLLRHGRLHSGGADWWKHMRKFGKRLANKAIRRIKPKRDEP